MRITEAKIRSIIKEEIKNILRENMDGLEPEKLQKFIQAQNSVRSSKITSVETNPPTIGGRATIETIEDIIKNINEKASYDQESIRYYMDLLVPKAQQLGLTINYDYDFDYDDNEYLTSLELV